jgi:hypothetical protein
MLCVIASGIVTNVIGNSRFRNINGKLIEILLFGDKIRSKSDRFQVLNPFDESETL